MLNIFFTLFRHRTESPLPRRYKDNNSAIIDKIASPGILQSLYMLMLSIYMCTPVFAQSHTNIILIVSDDQGFNNLGTHGNEVIHTPNLDRLAEEGGKVTNFYVTGPGCTPSRSCFLTSRYPERNGLYDMIRNDWPPAGTRMILYFLHDTTCYPLHITS